LYYIVVPQFILLGLATQYQRIKSLSLAWDDGRVKPSRRSRGREAHPGVAINSRSVPYKKCCSPGETGKQHEKQ
jgi:hypothetical protein